MNTSAFKPVLMALVAGTLTITSTCLAQALRPTPAADKGDGTYANPPLYADFPDPDIIRVGDDFYFATTTFANTPGLTILHSRDLVHWEYAAHVLPRLDGREQYDLKNGNAYRNGIYAPSLRYHDGTFYVAVTPNGEKTRIYRSRNINGPWTYRELDRVAFDPGLFFDADGKAYLFTSGGWDGTLTLLTLNSDLSRVEDASQIYYNKGAEGSKVIRRGDWYYLFNAVPSRLGMTVSRARNLKGPWETHNQIDDTTGGHQGALVDLPDGGWYGFVMVDAGAIGRVTQISPVFWQDDWPVWGTPAAPNRVPLSSPLPLPPHPELQLATSDGFDDTTLGVQWQWNHNPDDARWSLQERPGFMRLKATRADALWTARNTLTQKGFGPASHAVVKLDISHLQTGDRCGAGTLGKYSAQATVETDTDGRRTINLYLSEDTTEGQKTDVLATPQPLNGDSLYLRTDMNFITARGRMAYSTDGDTWTPLGSDFTLAYDWRTGTFQGPQFALFCFNPAQSSGYLDIDSFKMTIDNKAG
ncbi:glycoside hydrolase family 43 protein [Asticcacaulis taihuensis]|uniref:glycoside hydrolase family 43 protein n=1 Tax=Asticcacaulis taihuensis TaxID=260084 RepID=UPI003F7B9FC5